MKVTVLVAPAGRVTGWLTWTGLPPPGGETCAVTRPVCWEPVLLATSACTVSAAVLMSAASFCVAYTLLTPSASETCSCTGNWIPVLLSGGIWLQSTSSSVNMEFGLLGKSLQGQGVGAAGVCGTAEQVRDVEGVAGVVALDGGLRGHLGAVDPDVGLAHHAVDDQLGVLAGPQAGGEVGAEPPGHVEQRVGVRALLGLRRAEALLHVVGVEDAAGAVGALVDRLEALVQRAQAVLEQGLDLGADGAGVVSRDREPARGGEAGRGNGGAALSRAVAAGPVGGRGAALHLPAAADRRVAGGAGRGGGGAWGGGGACGVRGGADGGHLMR